MTQTPPRWDLSKVYPSLESPEFLNAFSQLKQRIIDFEEKLCQIESLGVECEPALLADPLNHSIEWINETSLLVNTLEAYVYSFTSTDSFNNFAKRTSSELDQLMVELRKYETRMRRWVGILAPLLPQITERPGSAYEHTFWLKETAEQSRFLMSQPEESLASELSLDGAMAWSKLQGTITSQHTVDFDLEGEVKKLSLSALINLRTHPMEEVRRRAYEAEMVVWESIKEPLAAALNGIKGTVNTLNRRRGRQDGLHSALDHNRINRETLEALLSVMRESFPMFRRYFQAKARLLNKPQLAWWDLFAPVGKASRTFTYDEARRIVLNNFERFSSTLTEYARRALDNNWIDAEQRPGKLGGGFCMSVPGVKESRILINFDGSLDSITTLAHELGHGFHNECMFLENRTELQRQSPMTMNETASIMCETIVVNALLELAEDPQEELGILDISLNSDSQVIVDVYSRYLFEKEVFERREQAELSADDYNEIMERAQKETYSDGLDPRYLQKFMWTWKPHYYLPELSFYNFPYAFGLLFANGLYSVYRQRGLSFVPAFHNLLANTGMERAAELALRFGIDIQKPDFWRSSMEVINQRVDRFVELSGD